jgi:hypothetical protein
MSNPLRGKLYTCCTKCERVYIPLYNAGILPMAYSVFMEMPVGANVTPETIDVVKFVQSSAKLPLKDRAKALSKLNFRDAPDAVFGGTRKGDTIIQVAYDEGSAAFTAAVVELLDNRKSLAHEPWSIGAKTQDSRYWKCSNCDEIQAYVVNWLNGFTFTGNSLAEATSELNRVIRPGKLVSMVVERDGDDPNFIGRSETIIEAKDAADAVTRGTSMHKDDAHDFAVVRVERDVIQGAIVVEADSQENAKRNLLNHPDVPSIKGLLITKVECTRQPRKGLLGLGSRSGQFTIAWRVDGRYVVSFAWWPTKLTTSCLW